MTFFYLMLFFFKWIGATCANAKSKHKRYAGSKMKRDLRKFTSYENALCIILLYRQSFAMCIHLMKRNFPQSVQAHCEFVTYNYILED